MSRLRRWFCTERFAAAGVPVFMRASPAPVGLATAVVSPSAVAALCVLFAGLFALPTLVLGPLTTHMATHIGLMNVVAPLLVLCCASPRTSPSGLTLALATATQVFVLWLAHAPYFHEAAPSSSFLAQAALLAAAFWFWWCLRHATRIRPWQSVAALLITGKLACLLGALLVFAPRVLLGHHGHPLSPVALEDQQVAGLLMLAACPLSYVLTGILLAARVLRDLRAGPARPLPHAR